MTKMVLKNKVSLMKMMAVSLNDRFFFSALWPLNTFLMATGVFTHQSNSRWKRHLYRLWSFLVLGLAIQSGIYTFTLGNRSFKILFAEQQISVEKLIREVLMIDMIRLSTLVFDSIIHISLVFSIWPSVILYLETLGSVDFNLGRPKLSHLKRFSLIGLGYMLLEVFLFSTWRIYSIRRMLSTSSISWPFATQNFIKLVANHWFSVVPVWIYYICGQLHVLYVEKMVFSLNLLKEMSRNTRAASSIVSRRSFTIMRSLKHLYSAADLLHRRFSTVLIVNSCSALIIMLSSSYYSIEFLRKGDVVMLCRDGSDIVGSFIRLWLTCHTADRIREAATECIPILRELRDRTTGKAESMDYTDRIKITSYIIEISQLEKTMDRQSLYGLLPLSKSLIIPMVETIFTYLIIIYQLKTADR